MHAEVAEVDVTQPGVVVSHALWGRAWKGITMGCTGEEPRLCFVDWRFPHRATALARPGDLVAL
jgi:hypothetical protein